MSRNGISLFREGKWEAVNKHKVIEGKRFSAFCVATTGEVWIGSDRGIYSFDGKEWRCRYEVPGHFKGWQASVMTEDKHGRIWAGSDKHGILVLDGDSTEVITMDSGLIGNDIKEIFPDPRGNVWAVSRTGISRIFTRR